LISTGLLAYVSTELNVIPYSARTALLSISKNYSSSSPNSEIEP
jgi:hypothetical protein